MDQPGAFQLPFNGNALSVTGPGTFTSDEVDGLAGLLAAAFQVDFRYGGGGASVAVFLQTSIDQGQTWTDIASIALTTASAVQLVNLSALTPVATPVAATQQQLAPGTTVDGLLGDRFRAVVVVTGTYTSTTLLNITGVAR